MTIFENPKFGAVRTITENGRTLFCGTDIAKALGYSQPHKAIDRHCRHGTKRTVPHPQSQNKMIEMLFIPEGDIYRLAAKSELPGAEEFESWIFDEVLPSIRRTGAYSISNTDQHALQLNEVTESLRSIQSSLNDCSARLSKVEDTTSYSNYYLRLQMRSGYDKDWKRKQSVNLKAISNFIGVDMKKILSEIYREMERRYGISLDAFCSDYKRTKSLESCSTLSVISFSLTLRQMFDAIINEVLETCHLSPADNERISYFTLLDMAEKAAAESGKEEL